MLEVVLFGPIDLTGFLSRRIDTQVHRGPNLFRIDEIGFLCFVGVYEKTVDIVAVLLVHVPRRVRVLAYPLESDDSVFHPPCFDLCTQQIAIRLFQDEIVSFVVAYWR
ncbi:hypothetical protein CK500_02425 [Halorubrum salipaludis]|uniref:Uncharacterized protein n=1 Tax=Halorubrum salipaludis TaxID=2032630 RepID=A0A2A2FLA2_9EURY|nr:hypothetical protein CK500_02425 [Halorubrum salipaludis]